ncbi:simple sugar transport system permease protein [Pilibacter termitis]|uniref:Simple sugar transport system permease protein n=1 Tax=Pilibacter termitis TaxID=263852 RepID=A0A1T4MI67_9ENTE|nr:ABC transporter permease [Pilibacter termitis]SJZ66474.1 simple sugar transport system permease protein [Pilibacter termitis]
MSNLKERLDIKALLIPLIAVVFGFMLGAVIMLIFGYNPIEGYQAMIQSALQNPFFTGETLSNATPLIFTALGFAVANSAGFFNIGLSGQALCGWVASVWVALANPTLPKPILLPLAIIIGMLAGAIAAGIPGALRAYFGTSEVITTIMLNYVYLYLAGNILHNVWPKSYLANTDSTNVISENASLTSKFMQGITGGSSLNNGFILAILFLILVWFLMKKTTTGFEIRAVGLNPFASEYAGISSKRTIITSMLISGALAGLGGVVQGLGYFQNYSNQATSLSIGFDGMAVSLLGNGSSIGIFLSAILFAILRGGSAGMQAMNIPAEIAQIVAASIIFFVGANYLVRLLLDKLTKDKEKVALEVAGASINASEEKSKDKGNGGEAS